MLRLSLVIVVLAVLTACGGNSSSSTTRAIMGDTSAVSSSKQSENRSSTDAAMHIKIRKRREFTSKEIRERKRPSEVPGLTKGQLEDMPSVPALPTLFGLQSTEAQLDAHAMICAREDVNGGRADLFTIEQRFLYIKYVWMQDWQARKKLLQGVKDEHADYSSRLRTASARNAAWLRASKSKEQAHQLEMERLHREDLPVLTAEERRTLGH